MSHVVILPVLVPLAGAVLVLAAWRRPRAQRLIGLAGSVGVLVAAVALLVGVEAEGVLTLQVGDWPAPFGITMVADRFSAILVLLAGILGVVVTVYSIGAIDARRERFGYHAFVMALLAGVCGTFLAGDLFNLYVWFELLLIASFALLALGGERAQLEGGLKYVALNLVSSALLLVTIGVLYGLTGTVNLADLARRIPSIEPHGLVTGLEMMLLVAFGIKAACAPFFFWLPASYHTPPVAVAAIFAGLLTKVGVYALVRVFTLLFASDMPTLQPLFLGLAAVTMVVGVLGAVAQHEMRRLLSFHIISQIGYLVMALGLFTVPALAGLIYFLVHVAIAKAALFLVSGLVARLTGSYELVRTGGLYASSPGLTAVFLVAALSLAGVPPFSGFLAKLSLVEAGLATGQGAVVAVSLAVSILTLYSMLKIWNAAFWKPHPGIRAPADDAGAPAGTAGPDRPPGRARAAAAAFAAPGALAACSIALVVAAGPVFGLMDRAAAALIDPEAYIAAVLGVVP